MILPQQDDQVPGQRLLQQGHVVGQTRHQLAGAPLGIEAERQLLQVGVDVDANIGHGVFAGVGQGHLLDERKERLEDNNDQQDQRHQVEIADVLADEDEVNQVAHHQRQHQPQQGTDDQGKDSHAHPAPIGANVAQQAGEGGHAATGDGRRGSFVGVVGPTRGNSSAHELSSLNLNRRSGGRRDGFGTAPAASGNPRRTMHPG